MDENFIIGSHGESTEKRKGKKEDEVKYLREKKNTKIVKKNSKNVKGILVTNTILHDTY